MSSWGLLLASPAHGPPTPLPLQPRGSGKWWGTYCFHMQPWRTGCCDLQQHLRSKGGVVRTTVTLWHSASKQASKQAASSSLIISQYWEEHRWLLARKHIIGQQAEISLIYIVLCHVVQNDCDTFHILSQITARHLIIRSREAKFKCSSNLPERLTCFDVLGDMCTSGQGHLRATGVCKKSA